MTPELKKFREEYYVSGLGQQALSQEQVGCAKCRERRKRFNELTKEHKKQCQEAQKYVPNAKLENFVQSCSVHSRHPKRRYGSLRTRRRHKQMLYEMQKSLGYKDYDPNKRKH